MTLIYDDPYQSSEGKWAHDMGRADDFGRNLKIGLFDVPITVRGRSIMTMCCELSAEQRDKVYGKRVYVFGQTNNSGN